MKSSVDRDHRLQPPAGNQKQKGEWRQAQARKQNQIQRDSGTQATRVESIHQSEEGGAQESSDDGDKARCDDGLGCAAGI